MEVYIRVIALGLILLRASGSGNYTDSKLRPEAPVPQEGLDSEPLTFDFEAIKSVVFQSPSGRCLECHSAARGNRGGLNLETHANTLALKGDIKFDIENNLMPRTGGPLADYECRIILQWIAMGAPEFSDEPLPLREEI